MQALGSIEVVGLVAGVEAADVACKTAAGKNNSLGSFHGFKAVFCFNTDTDDFAGKRLFAVNRYHFGVYQNRYTGFFNHFLLNLYNVGTLTADGRIGSVTVVSARAG